MWGDSKKCLSHKKISKPDIQIYKTGRGICPNNNVERLAQGVVATAPFLLRPSKLQPATASSAQPPTAVPRCCPRQFRAATKTVPSCDKGSSEQRSTAFGRSSGQHKHSTWLGLLQYLARITPVLDTDYSSTWHGLLQHFGRIPRPARQKPARDMTHTDFFC